jgi:hypothetical protein
MEGAHLDAVARKAAFNLPTVSGILLAHIVKPISGGGTM